MGYRITIERRAKSKFLPELRDWQVRFVAIDNGVDKFASAWSISLEQVALLYKKPLPSQRTNSWGLRLSRCSLLL